MSKIRMFALSALVALSLAVAGNLIFFGGTASADPGGCPNAASANGAANANANSAHGAAKQADRCVPVPPV